MMPTSVDSTAIRDTYTTAYFLEDCGGYNEFLATRGRRLDDTRLQSAAGLALLAPTSTVAYPRRAIELGCGRGEMSVNLARAGYHVTAIDYSTDAINLARSTTQDAPDLAKKIDWVCDSVLTAPFESDYALAMATDVIEHLAPHEVDAMYARVAAHLAQDGVFVLHTFPNTWYYDYDYPAQRRAALKSGAAQAQWPVDPRTDYERLMHVNEQNPRVMQRQLQQHFRYVRLWFGQHDDPIGNLASEKNTRRYLREARSLYAVASHQPITDAQIMATCRMNAIESSRGPIALSAATAVQNTTMRAGSRVDLPVIVSNVANQVLASFAPHPVHLSYHWLPTTVCASPPQRAECVVYDGARTKLFPPQLAGTTCEHLLAIDTPDAPGEYRLMIALVQEGVRWFDNAPDSPLILQVTILA
jgi:cyclopropane fatty-acyl-phospholipid synthase-like methyltransferase